MDRPGRVEIRKFGGSLITLGVVLWITYATAISNNGKIHYLPRWTLFLAVGGCIAGIAIVIGAIVWPTSSPPPPPPSEG